MAFIYSDIVSPNFIQRLYTAFSKIFTHQRTLLSCLAIYRLDTGQFIKLQEIWQSMVKSLDSSKLAAFDFDPLLNNVTMGA